MARLRGLPDRAGENTVPVFSRSLFWNWLAREPGVRVDLLFARFSEVLENID